MLWTPGRPTDNFCDLYSLSRHRRCPTTSVRRSIRPVPRRQHPNLLCNGILNTNNTTLTSAWQMKQENPEIIYKYSIPTNNIYQSVCLNPCGKQAPFSGKAREEETQLNDLREGKWNIAPSQCRHSFVIQLLIVYFIPF